jgi:hypothetical protein
MTLKPFGEKRKKIRIADITKEGVTLEIKERLYPMSYEDFPWLKSLTAPELGAFYLIYEDQDPEIIQPDLEIILGLEVLENPKKFPNLMMDDTLSMLHTLPRDTAVVQSLKSARDSLESFPADVRRDMQKIFDDFNEATKPLRSFSILSPTFPKIKRQQGKGKAKENA